MTSILFLIGVNLRHSFQMQLSKKQKKNLGLFLQFLKSRLNFKHLEKKDSPHSLCILEITDCKKHRQISKKSRFRRPFNNRHGKRSQTLLKSDGQHIYHNYWWLWRQLSWKKSLLVICNILRLFVNRLTTDDKYSLLNRNNFHTINSDAII